MNPFRIGRSESIIEKSVAHGRQEAVQLFGYPACPHGVAINYTPSHFVVSLDSLMTQDTWDTKQASGLERAFCPGDMSCGQYAGFKWESFAPKVHPR